MVIAVFRPEALTPFPRMRTNEIACWNCRYEKKFGLKPYMQKNAKDACMEINEQFTTGDELADSTFACVRSAMLLVQ